MADAAELKNGTAMSSVAPAVNRQLVQMLESALADAKAGRIVAGGIVAVIDPVQFMAFAADGGMPASVIAGAELMKADVIMKMRQPRPGAILRAGPQSGLRN